VGAAFQNEHYWEKKAIALEQRIAALEAALGCIVRELGRRIAALEPVGDSLKAGASPRWKAIPHNFLRDHLSYY
jgi:hypothetical protein